MKLLRIEPIDYQLILLLYDIELDTFKYLISLKVTIISFLYKM